VARRRWPTGLRGCGRRGGRGSGASPRHGQRGPVIRLVNTLVAQAVEKEAAISDMRSSFSKRRFVGYRCPLHHAWATSVFTSRITGASLAMSRRCSSPRPPRRPSLEVLVGHLRWPPKYSPLRPDLVSLASTGSIRSPVAGLDLPNASQKSSGSAIASRSVESCIPTGTTFELPQKPSPKRCSVPARAGGGPSIAQRICN